MNFGQALEALKAGDRVARKGWNGKDMWLILIHPKPEGVIVDYPAYRVGGVFFKGVNELLPWIGMKTADSKFVPWPTSQIDILVEDWEVVE
jgi:hypothetical protein